MKNFTIILLLFLLASLVFCAYPVQAIVGLNNVALSIDPQNAGSLATWTISFSLPETAKIGHFLISFGGYQPDLSGAALSISGISGGTAVVGKSNANCVSNCDDVRYYFKDPVEIKKDTKIVFNLNKVKNPVKSGQTGLNFINVFSSKYPQLTLVYSAGEKLVDLLPAVNLPDEGLIPATATNENEDPTKESDITQVILNELFYKPGAKTTKLSAIKDPSKVADFTLDVVGKVRVAFNGVIDLSKPEAAAFFERLSDYLTFDDLFFEVKKEFYDYFKVPLDLTFYNVPYVWETDIQKNDREIIPKDQVENFQSYLYDDKAQNSFTINEAGSYRLLPHFELNIADNQEIKKDSNLATFSGRISDPQAVIKIVVNGAELKDVKPAIDLQRGEFAFAAVLLVGPNLIEAQAQSEYGQIPKITKIVQYIPPEAASKPVAKPGISLFNMTAIILAVLAIILIVALRYLVKKRKR